MTAQFYQTFTWHNDWIMNGEGRHVLGGNVFAPLQTILAQGNLAIFGKLGIGWEQCWLL